MDYSSLVKCPGYDVTHIEETTFALSESEIDHLIGGVDHTGSVTASAYGFIGKGETLELLKVGLKELQRGLEQVKALTTHVKTLRECESILDRKAHIRHSKLGFHCSITILHRTMNNALRMHQHLDSVGINAKEPFCLNDFKAFIHHRSRVDGNLCTHIPCRMLERIGCRDTLHLLQRELAERTSRGCKQDFLYLIAMVSDERLEDSGML